MAAMSQYGDIGPGGGRVTKRPSLGARILNAVAITLIVVTIVWLGFVAWVAYGAAVRAAAQLQIRPHIVPVEAAAPVAAPTIGFTFDGASYAITPHVAGSVYAGAAESTRALVRTSDQTDAQWADAYFAHFTSDPAQLPAIDDVVAQLRAIRATANLDSDGYLELIAKYVQSIPYDDAQAASGTLRQRFPVETLVDGKGLCGDKSVLLATLLAREGYAVALLEFPPEQHMAVGVRGPGTSYDSTGWLFLETTAPTYVTDVPTSYSDGMRLTSRPKVHVVGSGTRTYGAAADIARIVHVRDRADAAATALYDSAKSQQLTFEQAAKINRELDSARTASISLRSNVIDERHRPIGVFMDRPQALRWIARYAWW
jgi:transglutaminase-like putative cysteine protease